MKVTRVDFKRVNIVSSNKEKAFLAECSVVLDDCLLLDSVKLFNFVDKGYFLIFPSSKMFINL